MYKSFSSLVFHVLQLYCHLRLYLYLYEAITDFASQSTCMLFLSCISYIAIVFLSVFVFVFAWSHHRLCFPEHTQAFPLLDFLYCNYIFVFICNCIRICLKPSQTSLPIAHTGFFSLGFLVFVHIVAIIDLRTWKKEEFVSFMIIHPIIKKDHLAACPALKSPFLL